MQKTIQLFTIGFTKKSAAEFFGTLKQAGVKRVVDVRIHNVSQLAGFAKKDDLAYFLREIAGIEYVHMPVLAPTEALMVSYRRGKRSWESLSRQFTKLITERGIEKQIEADMLDKACLLCSEDTPDKCHRRLVAEYLRDHWKDVDVQITHLV